MTLRPSANPPGYGDTRQLAFVLRRVRVVGRRKVTHDVHDVDVLELRGVGEERSGLDGVESGAVHAGVEVQAAPKPAGRPADSEDQRSICSVLINTGVRS